MPFVPMKDLLDDALAGGYAVPGFCAWTAEAMRTILRVAGDLHAPVILMNGPAEFPLMPPDELAAVAGIMARFHPARAALHLDHGASPEDVEACLAAGYTSVMLDYSSRPFDENAAALRQVAALAHPRGVTVEGELGHVGRNDNETAEGGEASTFTDPAEAAEYVLRTGVDALAVSIGNAHGQYTRLPRLDFDRLAAIREAVSVPLVLHGGSGTPEEDLKRAISMGIAKVNVATDLVTGVRKSLQAQWATGDIPWLPQALAVAMEPVAEVVSRWIHRTGAAGKAT